MNGPSGSRQACNGRTESRVSLSHGCDTLARPRNPAAESQAASGVAARTVRTAVCGCRRGAAQLGSWSARGTLIGGIATPGFFRTLYEGQPFLDRGAPRIPAPRVGHPARRRMRRYEDIAKLRPHMQTCLSCRAALREFRAMPERVESVVPPAALAVTDGAGRLESVAESAF